MDDLDDLLDVLDDINLTTIRTANKRQEESILWIWFKGELLCKCGRVYSGEFFCPSISPTRQRYIEWCPECLNKELFFSHQNFRVTIGSVV